MNGRSRLSQSAIPNGHAGCGPFTKTVVREKGVISCGSSSLVYIYIYLPHRPSLISFMVSVNVKHPVCLLAQPLSLTLSKASAFSTAHCPWRASSVEPPYPATTSSVELVLSGGAGIAQWLERRTRD